MNDQAKPQEDEMEVELADPADMPAMGHLMSMIMQVTPSQAGVLILDLGQKMDIGVSFKRDYADREAMIKALRETADKLEKDSDHLDKVQAKAGEIHAQMEAETAAKH